jgi:hypothetical protein
VLTFIAPVSIDFWCYRTPSDDAMFSRERFTGKPDAYLRGTENEKQ